MIQEFVHAEKRIGRHKTSPVKRNDNAWSSSLSVNQTLRVYIQDFSIQMPFSRIEEMSKYYVLITELRRFISKAECCCRAFFQIVEESRVHFTW